MTFECIWCCFAISLVHARICIHYKQFCCETDGCIWINQSQLWCAEKRSRPSLPSTLTKRMRCWALAMAMWMSGMRVLYILKLPWSCDQLRMNWRGRNGSSPGCGRTSTRRMHPVLGMFPTTCQSQFLDSACSLTVGACWDRLGCILLFVFLETKSVIDFEFKLAWLFYLFSLLITREGEKSTLCRGSGCVL